MDLLRMRFYQQTIFALFLRLCLVRKNNFLALCSLIVFKYGALITILPFFIFL